MLLVVVLAACATTHHVGLPRDGFSIEGVNPGDDVELVMADGQKHRMTVSRIDELGLHGGEEFYFYDDMRSVAVIEKKQSSNAWWLVAVLVVIAVFAEPDDSGSGPLCLRSSEGGPCLD